MIGVDKIGEIRRAYFEQGRSIKEIVRTLSTSRATVRKVIRGHKTEFKYARVVQPTPKLGDWVEALTEILEQESKLPKRERRSTQRSTYDKAIIFPRLPPAHTRPTSRGTPNAPRASRALCLGYDRVSRFDHATIFRPSVLTVTIAIGSPDDVSKFSLLHSHHAALKRSTNQFEAISTASSSGAAGGQSMFV